ATSPTEYTTVETPLSDSRCRRVWNAAIIASGKSRSAVTRRDSIAAAVRAGSGARGLASHRAPQLLDVAPLGRERANRDAHHPAAVEERRGQVGAAGAVERIGPGAGMAVERLAFEAGRLVPNADGLQPHRRDEPP